MSVLESLLCDFQFIVANSGGKIVISKWDKLQGSFVPLMYHTGQKNVFTATEIKVISPNQKLLSSSHHTVKK